jgi:hypothetical protein
MIRDWQCLAVILAMVLTVHVVMAEPTEPFFNGDETQHVMTGIFVADAITDGGVWRPRSYAEQYYAQYPALGLIVWPPGFYTVEGVAMLVFGRDFETARWLTVAYSLIATLYLFRIVRFTHDLRTACVAALLFAFTREVFFHSRNVMLEVPTVAFILMAIFHLERYLASRCRGDLVGMAIACVLAGLHRYDAVAIVPMILARLILTRQWAVLTRKSVILAAILVIIMLAPIYGLAAHEIGGVQSRAAAAGSDPTSIKASLISQWTYLPRTLWAHASQAVCALGVVGLVLSARDAKSAPYIAIIIGTFLFFAPLAEQETRHGIDWLPGWCALAAIAINRLTKSFKQWLTASILAIVATAFWTLHQPVTWVRGYSPAAKIVIDSTTGPATVLFNGLLSGTFIYEIRTQDHDRRIGILRGDKLLYGTLSDPHLGYVEYATDDAAMLARLADISPDYLVVESPHAKYEPPASIRLRKLLDSRPDLFAHVAEMPLANNNREWLDGVRLVIYKPFNVKPYHERSITIPMLWQDRSITVSPRS